MMANPIAVAMAIFWNSASKSNGENEHLFFVEQVAADTAKQL